MLLASCQRELERGGAPDIQATVEVEPETKTSLSVNSSGMGTIYWNQADKIDVFFGTKKARYTSQNSFNATTAVFKTSDDVIGSDITSSNIWGLYPSNSSSSCNGSSVTTTLPSAQYGVQNTFDDDLFLAVSHSSTTSLQFYNVCGGIKFSLAYEDVTSISLSGNANEDLAGRVSISFAGVLPKVTVVNGAKVITLTPKNGGAFTKGADYYIIILPCTLAEGFTMTFTFSDGSTRVLRYADSPVTIKRSVFGRKAGMDAYSFPVPEIVDLGLSVKWASFNLGASKPEEDGNYYAWGETETKNQYTRATYKFNIGSDSETVYSKYNTQSNYGIVDNKTILDPEDDAAHVILGDGWRMPTKEEYEELHDNCTWVWTTLNERKGYWVTSNRNGRSIFLPACGNWFGDAVDVWNQAGVYWSSSLCADSPTTAWPFLLMPSGVYSIAMSRSTGASVRPIFSPI